MARFLGQLKTAGPAGGGRRFPTSGHRTAFHPVRPKPAASQAGVQGRLAAAALDEMASIVAGLGDVLANRTPAITGANSPYAILTHCLGVVEFWIGHVLRGRPTTRDRAAEFTAHGDVEPLLAGVTTAKQQLRIDLSRPLPSTLQSTASSELGITGSSSSENIVLHVLEELHQHLGQMEITRDLIVAQNSPAGLSTARRLLDYSEQRSASPNAYSARSAAAMKGESDMDFRLAARQLLDLMQVPLGSLWLGFWAEGGDANILELEAYINHQIWLPPQDAACLGTAVENFKANLNEPVSAESQPT